MRPRSQLQTEKQVLKRSKSLIEPTVKMHVRMISVDNEGIVGSDKCKLCIFWLLVYLEKKMKINLTYIFFEHFFFFEKIK